MKNLSNLSHPNILIVDDDPVQLEYLEIMVSKHANPIKALSGLEGIEKAAGINFALALIDVKMPGMNGYDFAVELNKNRVNEKIPVIFLTSGPVNQEQIIAGYESGAVDYIPKPVNKYVLQSKVNIFIDLFNQKQKLVQNTAELKEYADKLAMTNSVLKKSEEKFRSYVDNAPDGVFVVDETGRYLEVNDAACRITGYPRGELLTMTIADILPEESLAAGLAHFNLVVQTGTAKSDLMFRHKNGFKRWWSVDAVKLTETRFLGFAKDITEQKQAEKRLQDIIVQNPVSIQILDKEGFTIQVNSAHTKLFGAVLPSDHSIFTDVQLLQRGMGEIFERMKNGEVVQFPDSYFNAHDSISELPDVPVCIRAIGFPLNDNNGQPERFVFMHENITESKRAEEALFKSERKLETMLQTMVEGIVSIDLNGEINYCNKTAEQILDMSKTVLGKYYQSREWNQMDEKGNPYPQEQLPLAIVLREQRTVTNVEHALKSSNGKLKWLSVNAAPLFDAKGQLYGGIASFQDITKRKQAENALKESEEKYRLLINNASESIVVAQDGMLRFVNFATLDLLEGYSEQELLDKPFIEFIHPDDRSMVVENHRKRVANETLPPWYAFRVVTRDGIIKWVEINVALIKWQGKPATLNFLSNISKRRKAEEALLESENKFRAIFESNSAPLAIIEPDTTISMVNEAYCKVSGYTKQEVIGMSWTQQIPPEELERLKEFNRKRLINPKDAPNKYEFTFRHKNGKIRHAFMSVAMLSNQKIIASFLDITDRKIAEQALKVSEEKYRTMLNASPDGIFITTLKGIITDVSDIGLELYGSDNRNDLIGKHFWRFVPHHEKPVVKEIIEKTLNEGLLQNVEIQIRKKNQSLFLSETSSTLIQGPDGAPVSFMIILRDISQRKRIEKKQIHADRMASLGEMASGIAHEINQPLNTISLALDNVVFEAQNQENLSKEYLKKKSDKIFENIARIRNIIDHVRAFSSSHDDYVLTGFDINTSIKNAVSMISEQFKHRGINLNLQLEENLPMILGNTFKFEQVILNLLSNAKDAVLDKKNILADAFEMLIQIRSFQENEYIHVEIADNGTGISEEDIEHIMLPFYTTKDAGKGTGLGLSISYQIIKEMNGNIELSSNPSMGTTFKIILKHQNK